MHKLSGYVIFSDDVRLELNNKRSFIGVYGTQMVVPELPAIVPRLCVTTTLICYRGELPRALSISLVYGDVEISRVTVSDEELKEWRENSEAELAAEVSEFPQDDPPKVRLSVMIQLSPLGLISAGRISAFVETDKGRIRAGSIKIIQGDTVRT